MAGHHLSDERVRAVLAVVGERLRPLVHEL